MHDLRAKSPRRFELVVIASLLRVTFRVYNGAQSLK
jgi:hypothetical protein